MALVPCPECQKEVSTEAWACPQCAYPFPGKKNTPENRPAVEWSTCPECEKLISTPAQFCPHCGVAFHKEEWHRKHHEAKLQEVSLRPHGGSSHALKITQPADARVDLPSPFPAISKNESVKTADVGKKPTGSYRRDPVSQSSRRHSLLWQEGFVGKNTTSRSPRPSKHSLMIGLLLLVIVAVSVLFGALWQLQGLTPVEALLSWRM